MPGMRAVLLLCMFVSLLAALSCEPEPEIITEPAPNLTIPPFSQQPPLPLSTIAEENFDDGIEDWYTFADEGATSEIGRDDTCGLLWTVKTTERQAAILVHHWPDLKSADGLTISMESLDRSAFLVMSVQEADGSSYSLVLPLSKGENREYSAPFEGFSLQSDSKDENDRLDMDQVDKLFIIDISAHIAAPGENRIAIDYINLWTGRPDPAGFFCKESNPSNAPNEFRVGVDANFIPQGEKQHGGYQAGDKQVDPLELFAVNGVDSLRLRLWVGDSGDYGLDYATELARRAQDAGIRPYLALFLHDDWNDVNKQNVPAVWTDLSFDERAAAIRDYCRETAQHFIDKGIDFDFYEIGNEIDYGICGVFAGTDHPRDPASLKKDTWPDEAVLLKAAIEGVRESDPQARFMLHIANSWDPQFVTAFYRAMLDFGVQYDYCGLSFYPTAFGVATASRICDTLDGINSEIGRPVIIAETAYPAEPPSGELFGDWRRLIPGYPLTPEGQANWLNDFYTWMKDRNDVIGVYVFSPDFWFSGDIWSAFALFDGEGRARPAIAAFNAGH